MTARTPAVILAGGLSRRMGGGDKGLLPLGDGTVLSHVLARLSPQAAPIALSANGDPRRFATLGLPVLPDPMPGHPGPLAGILAAIEWAAAHGTPSVLTAPGDAPFIPFDLLQKLSEAGAPALAASGGRVHAAIGLWPSTLAPLLRKALSAGIRKVQAFAEAQGACVVTFAIPDSGLDPFLNLNTPEDLATARRWAR